MAERSWTNDRSDTRKPGGTRYQVSGLVSKRRSSPRFRALRLLSPIDRWLSQYARSALAAAKDLVHSLVHLNHNGF
nr:hypothetical protein [Kibdelosporangium sp. MJ126-NF4]CTQ89244.1 hypothetical protein [Kibdelosporangium sp. MJ126-NF4]